MAETKIANIVTPELWSRYHAEKFSTLNAFWTSGIVRDVSSEVQTQIGGTEVNLPFWKPLTASGTVLVDTANITPAAYVAAQASAPIVGRVNAWSRTDLAAVLAGSDPASALMSHVLNVELQEKQNTLISSLTGAFVAGNENLLDISALSGAAAVIDSDAIYDAEQKLGDAKSQLVAYGMHSATETALLKQDKTAWDYQAASDGKARIPFYRGKRVIVDDSLPVGSGAYTTFMFTAGSVAYANMPGPGFIPFETERNALTNGGQETVVSRLRYLIAPNGFRSTPVSGDPAAGGAGMSNAELALDAWTKVYDTKNVGIVALKAKLA